MDGRYIVLRCCEENVDLDFAYDVFQNIDWKKKDESTGVPSLSKTVINEVAVKIPHNDEQCTIGAFFRNLDKLITLHRRKLNHLKELKKVCSNKCLYREAVFSFYNL